MSKQDRQVVRTAPELERKLGGQRRSSSSDPSGSDPLVEQINQALQQYMNRTNAEIKNLKDNMGYLTPQIDITDIEGGHRITITDKDGTESFDVMDGTGGTTGTAADSEKLGGQLPEYYAKASDIPSLEGYAKTSEIPSLDGYAKTSDIPTVPSKVSAFENDKGYLTEHQDLSGYAKTSDIPSKISAFENDKGYLTEHQSLEEYAKNSALEDAVEEITAIAQGKCASYVLNTVDELDAWLSNIENTAKLKIGDVFLIRAVNVPDYWWDGATKQKLETTKVDLTEYAKKSEIPTIPSSLPANGGNADTVDGYHIRKVTNTSDTGQTGCITFIV